MNQGVGIYYSHHYKSCLWLLIFLIKGLGTYANAGTFLVQINFWWKKCKVWKIDTKEVQHPRILLPSQYGIFWWESGTSTYTPVIILWRFLRYIPFSGQLERWLLVHSLNWVEEDNMLKSIQVPLSSQDSEM